MMEKLGAGSILLTNGSTMPASMVVETDSYSSGWRMLRGVTRQTMEKGIQCAGWTFFFLAGTLRSTVFGFDREKSLVRAVRRLLAILDTNHHNCLEIDGILRCSFLGVPYVTVSAHERHVQAGSVLAGIKSLHPIPYRNYLGA
jgi:hypothetical protein